MPPIAHAGGHWYETVIYLIPVTGFMVWLGITWFKDRAARGAEEDPTEAGEQGEMNRAERRAAARRQSKEKDS